MKNLHVFEAFDTVDLPLRVGESQEWFAYLVGKSGGDSNCVVPSRLPVSGPAKVVYVRFGCVAQRASLGGTLGVWRVRIVARVGQFVCDYLLEGGRTLQGSFSPHLDVDGDTPIAAIVQVVAAPQDEEASARMVCAFGTIREGEG